MSVGIRWRLTANIFARIDCSQEWKIEVNGPWSDAQMSLMTLREKVCVRLFRSKAFLNVTKSFYSGYFVMSEIIYRFRYNRLNLTNVDEPFFVVDSLDSYTSYDTYGDDSLRAVVYAVNQKGRSHGALVKEFAFDGSAENRAGN